MKVSKDLIIIWPKGQFLEFLLKIPAVLDSADYSSNFENISSPGSEDTAISEFPLVSLALFVSLFDPPGLPCGFPGDPSDNLPANAGDTRDAVSVPGWEDSPEKEMSCSWSAPNVSP